MATDVIMPQMGESIAEGTIVKWLKKVGEEVKRDEPLFEISTDKVDAEIPSPSAGVLTEILATEGQTVPINTVVARIEVAGAQPAAEKPAAQPAKAAEPQPAPQPAAQPAPPPPQPQQKQPEVPAPLSTSAVQQLRVIDQQEAAPAVAAPAAHDGGSASAEELRKRSSPLVRKIARENNININQIEGTGISGRVTKNDILGFMEGEKSRPAQPAPTPAPMAQPAPQPAAQQPQYAPAPAAPAAPAVYAQQSVPSFPAYSPGDRVEIVPMTPMRKKISEHMVASRRISAHVQSFFEIDLTNIAKLREKHKESFLERNGVKLTFMPFIMKAAVDALKAFPIMNTSVEGDNIVYKKDINLGIAVALDWGLIVPVVKGADEKNLLGLTRAMNDLATRARKKQLKPDEVQGGTFTITNPGVFGSLFGTPIINQPQVAIMGVGTIEKRLSVMEDDSIAIRTKAYMSISFDHRIIDGAVADQFMGQVKKSLESYTTIEL